MSISHQSERKSYRPNRRSVCAHGVKQVNTQLPYFDVRSPIGRLADLFVALPIYDRSLNIRAFSDEMSVELHDELRCLG
jgi:hypothetical protein